METPASLPATERVRRRPSIASLAVWGMLGFVVGLVAGGFAVEVHGAQGPAGTTNNVRAVVWGVKVRQGTGPEDMDQVVWTWGLGLVALFGLAGANLGIIGRYLAERVIIASEKGQA